MNKIFFLVFLFSCVLYTASVSKLIKGIENKSFELKYYFWLTDNSDVFLMKKNTSGNSLWAYTSERKWRPLHNTGAFDGYDKEDINFKSIKYDDGYVIISSLTDKEMPLDVLKFNQSVQKKTHKIGYYFWKNENNTFYLVRENNTTSQSIWHYTKMRKWQPIHNADAFDGFPPASETIQNIRFNKNKSTITLGNMNIQPTSDGIILESSDLDKDNHYTSEFFTLFPNLSWSIRDSLKSKITNFIIIMKNTNTNDVIWSYKTKGNEYSISRTKNKEQSVLPYGEFCSKVYKHQKTKEKTINVSISIYAIDNLNILEDLECIKKVEKENISSGKINASLDVSILSNKIDNFYENSTNNGSISNKLTLKFNNKFTENLNSSFIDIVNLPQGLSASYDIDDQNLYIALEGKAIDNEGMREITITLNSKLWSQETSNQIINTNISFLDNTRSISDIQAEPYYKYSWHQKPMSKLGAIQQISNKSHINIEKAWKITRGKGAIVAIIDTDFDIYHSDLSNNIQSSFNAGTNNSDVFPLRNGSSHGTSVAGVIGATVNGEGTVGTAPESKMILINFPFSGPISNIIKAFDYAQKNGAKIINCSWGGRYASPALKYKLKELYDENIIVVFATGNNGINIDNLDIGAESKLPTVLGVGATNEDNIRALYSNYGSTLDFVAPGGKYGVLTTDVTGDMGINNTQNLVNKNYSFRTGTSFSAPNASGVIALMVSVNPKLTPDETREIIITTADKIVGKYDSDGFNIELGYGKLNAYKAVMKAKAMAQ